MPNHSTRPAASLRGIRPFLLYSNVLVGGIAAAFTLGTYGWLGLPVDVPLVVLAACGAYLVYQADRALHVPPEDAINQPYRQAWSRHHRGVTWGGTGLAIIGALVAMPFLSGPTLLLGVGLAALSLLYIAPLLPGRRRLKGIWFLKPLAIAAAWAVGGVVAPVVEAGQPVSLAIIMLMGGRLLFVLPNALLADWPDRAGDRQAGLSTPALRLSARTIRRLALLALAGSSGLLAMSAALLQVSWLAAVDGVGLVLMAWAVLRAPRASRWFYGVTIDVIVAWPGISWSVGRIAGAL
jgi:4-hydroxybenzoate polyprenyltransferase